MIKIFSYGTLWQSEIQLKEFGQTFKVDLDLDYISGWDLIDVKIKGKYYKLAIKSDDNIVITGAIVHVPLHLISIIDKYEGLEYERISIKTLCGNDCEMYVKRTFS